MFHDTIGLARNEIDRADRGGTEVGAIGVVAHRIVLSIVPQRGDSVAIKVAHHLACGKHDCRRSVGRRTCTASVGGEQIHRATVEGQLFGRVIVVHVLRVRLRAIEAERVGCAATIERVEVGIVVQEGVAQSIYGWRVRKRVKLRFSFRVQRVRIRTEIVVERSIFPEDDHDVFDRRSCFDVGGVCYRCQHWPGNHGRDEAYRQQLTHRPFFLSHGRRGVLQLWPMLEHEHYGMIKK